MTTESITTPSGSIVTPETHQDPGSVALLITIPELMGLLRVIEFAHQYLNTTSHMLSLTTKCREAAGVLQRNHRPGDPEYAPRPATPNY